MSHNYKISWMPRKSFLKRLFCAHVWEMWGRDPIDWRADIYRCVDCGKAISTESMPLSYYKPQPKTIA
jgi:hypothetical protein